MEPSRSNAADFLSYPNPHHNQSTSASDVDTMMQQHQQLIQHNINQQAQKYQTESSSQWHSHQSNDEASHQSDNRCLASLDYPRAHPYQPSTSGVVDSSYSSETAHHSGPDNILDSELSAIYQADHRHTDSSLDLAPDGQGRGLDQGIDRHDDNETHKSPGSDGETNQIVVGLEQQRPGASRTCATFGDGLGSSDLGSLNPFQVPFYTSTLGWIPHAIYPLAPTNHLPVLAVNIHPPNALPCVLQKDAGYSRAYAEDEEDEKEDEKEEDENQADTWNEEGEEAGGAETEEQEHGDVYSYGLSLEPNEDANVENHEAENDHDLENQPGNSEFEEAGQNEELEPDGEGAEDAELAESDFENNLSALLPPPPSIPGPWALQPANPDLMNFLRVWVTSGRISTAIQQPPLASEFINLILAKPARVQYGNVAGDEGDMQGINWTKLGVSRDSARCRRTNTYHNYVNITGSDHWKPDFPDVILPCSDKYFRFRRLTVRQNVYLAHFQLRNVLACPTRTWAYYPGLRGIHRLNTISGASDLAIDLSDAPSVQTTTLDAACGVLVAGTLHGEYLIKNVDGDMASRHSEGNITNAQSGITNHLQVYNSRNSSYPLVAFASNDQWLRVMDAVTQTFIMRTPYHFPINCTAISPDRRLRLLVGDSRRALVVNAETGQVVQSLPGHRDFVFSCAWSDDNWAVATGCQDRTVRVWDARRWCSTSGDSLPVRTIRSELAGVRGLRFSPAGSGRRVLVAAEEADFVSIIDVPLLAYRQTFDIFGEIAGLALTDEGRDLNVLCYDRVRGGLLQFERCASGPFPDNGDFGSARRTVSPNGGVAARSRNRAAIQDNMSPI